MNVTCRMYVIRVTPSHAFTILYITLSRARYGCVRNRTYIICTHPSGEGGGEGVRLKLQTPLSIADALLGAAGRQLAADLQAARSELEGVQLVRGGGGRLGGRKSEIVSNSTMLLC